MAVAWYGVKVWLLTSPDGTEPPLEPEDYEVLLDTPAKWNNAMTQYPTLRYRFLDQPYYPLTG